jgi:hypothetical protein
MLDALRYLDGKWMQEEAEFELFDEALGDDPTETIQVRVPQLRGIAANALLAFAHHAQTFNLIRRRPRTMLAQRGGRKRLSSSTKCHQEVMCQGP